MYWRVTLTAIVLFLVLAGLRASALPLDDMDATAYDVDLAVVPAKAGRVAVLLEAAATGVAVELRTDGVSMAAGKGTGVTVAWPTPLVPGESARVTLMRRGDRLAVALDGVRLGVWPVERGPGASGSVTADGGWQVREACVQRLEPLLFGDNFMRGEGERGPWRVARGEWALQPAWKRGHQGVANLFQSASFAQNPFAWHGRAPGGSGLCATGQPWWEGYAYTAAVCPAGGAVGLVANMPGADGGGLLIRWTSAADRGPDGNALTASLLSTTGRAVLATSPGGFVPGHWYAVSVATSPDGRAVVSIDGRERLTLTGLPAWRGGIGLYVEGDGGTFDDITVRGQGINTDPLDEDAVMRVNERFRNDQYMHEWADGSFDWDVGEGGWRVGRWDVYGDHWLTVRSACVPGGEMLLALGASAQGLPTGYVARIRCDTAGRPQYTILNGDRVLAREQGTALGVDDECVWRFHLAGGRAALSCDGTEVASAEANLAAPGRRAAYRLTGSFTQAKDIATLGRRMADYPFATAPVDWIGVGGLWQPTDRWVCSPQWSFLGGYGRGESVLWHKRSFTGDQSLQAFIGVKMEYPRERMMFDYRYRDLGITICGDGANPRSGYTAIHGAPAADGAPNARTVLMRAGVVVAQSRRAMPARSSIIYRDWFDVGIRRAGARVQFLIDGKVELTFDDPDPLPGGAPAIWSVDNGITIARARMHYAQAPTPRDFPWVQLDAPWHPEWADVGAPVTVAFPQPWATSGDPTQLRVQARAVPRDAGLPTIDGLALTWTPTVVGEHWYQVNAADGRTDSAGYHLSLPVFDPAVGRDDTHAVVLYRFDEGKGSAVRDAGVAPAADLVVPDGAPVTWLPGKGLHLDAPTALRTADGVPKLMALAKARAATIEAWVSNDTKYPLPGEHTAPDGERFVGTMLSWGEADNGRQNFAMGNQWECFVFAPRGVRLSSNTWGEAYTPARAYPLGLHHMVMTWNGTRSLLYIDGKPWSGQDAGLNWGVGQWQANLPLILGNMRHGKHPYLGTYYLVAIHDASLPAAQIKRHYDAGPSAR